jgi:general secretion pathway protein F
MRVELQVVQGRSAPRLLMLEAATIPAARTQAEAQGFSVIAARSVGISFGFPGLRRLNAKPLDVPVFIEQLRDLLGAGLSVIEALDALRRGAKGAADGTIVQLERSLQEGKRLSDALQAEPIFPELLVALVRASELTSDLPQSLTRFLEHEQRVTEVRHRLVSTSIYPLLLVGVGTLVMLFLLFYVMPRFARVFEGMSGNLPWSARAMVSWAQMLHAASGWWLTGGLLLILALIVPVLSASGRARLLERILRLTPLQQPLHTYFLARWYRATGMLVQGGIPFPQALSLANSLLPAHLRKAGNAVEQGVRGGLTPSLAHARAGMATPVAEQLLLAGERTGDLGAVLTRVAHFHEVEVSRTLERTMRALEPTVMVIIGLGVGLVVVLMYMPIFELASAIQ